MEIEAEALSMEAEALSIVDLILEACDESEDPTEIADWVDQRVSGLVHAGLPTPSMLVERDCARVAGG